MTSLRGGQRIQDSILDKGTDLAFRHGSRADQLSIRQVQRALPPVITLTIEIPSLRSCQLPRLYNVGGRIINYEN